MRNVMFKETPIPTPSRSAIDLSHEKKMSGQIGELMPFMWYEVVPGDKFRIRSEVLVKLAPMLAPVLHRIDVYCHYFFVPFRLLMNESGNVYAGWEKFITGDPDSYFTNEDLPWVTISNANKAYFAESSLADFLGLPIIDAGTTVTQTVNINVLPFYAYHLIYDDYFRDENLVDKYTGRTSGSDAAVWLIGGEMNTKIGDICILSPHQRAYEKDYFRGALPTAYYGASADVELDLDTEFLAGVGPSVFRNWSTGAAAPGAPTSLDIDAGAETELSGGAQGSVDVSRHTTATLEVLELRRAMALTRYLEAENRGGHRYIEMLLGVWGVVADDQSLQYPQYLGGGGR